RGNVVFSGPNSLLIGDEELRFDKLLIATGASPEIPLIEGLDSGPYLTSQSALELETMPESLVVMGGGYIGLELAQAFVRLGTNVTVVLRKDRLLGGIDSDVTASLVTRLSREGVNFVFNANVKSVSYESPLRVVTLLEREGVPVSLVSSHILVTTGRRPNLPLGLEKLGVDIKDGFIKVDEYLNTTNSNVYAAGDVVNSPAFVYVAANEGAIAAQNIIKDKSAATNHSIVPWVVFTEPQIAGVGLTEEQAKKQGFDIQISKLPMSALPRALVSANTDGFIKLIKPKGEDYLLGAVACMPGAGDIIMQIGLALRFKMSVKELSQTMHPYLTYSEAIKLCAQGFFKDIGKMSCCA
ncbi:MAG: mercury(II) reductase, partial [Proteobacteria bacterium]